MQRSPSQVTPQELGKNKATTEIRDPGGKLSWIWFCHGQVLSNFMRDLRLHRRMVSTKTQVSSVVLDSTYIDDVGIDDDGASAVVSVGGGGGVW